MKKIAVITSGLLPMPAVRGGAIETLLQYLIDYNEEHPSFLYYIYSIYDENAAKLSEKYKFSNFVCVRINRFFNKILFNFGRVIRRLGYSDPNFQLLYIKKVCKKLKKENYDLILIESDNHFVLPIKNVTTTPVVLYLHNDKLNNETKNSVQIFNSCFKILVVSDYIKSRVLTIDSNCNNKVTTILNGIDVSMFSNKNKDNIRLEMRKKYNIESDAFVFLFTGRIEANKGVLELVKAFNMIKNKKAKLFIIGGSFFSTNKKTNYVKMVENEIGSNENVLVTGYVPYKDIPNYHFLSDCMVSPSMWEEPGSLVNQETFASGLPLISSYSGGTPEYTKNTKSILIQKDNNFVNNLAVAMEKLIEDRELQQEMQKYALKASEYFNSERYCKDLVDYFERVMIK